MSNTNNNNNRDCFFYKTDLDKKSKFLKNLKKSPKKSRKNPKLSVFKTKKTFLEKKIISAEKFLLFLTHRQSTTMSCHNQQYAISLLQQVIFWNFINPFRNSVFFCFTIVFLLATC